MGMLVQDYGLLRYLATLLNLGSNSLEHFLGN